MKVHQAAVLVRAVSVFPWWRVALKLLNHPQHHRHMLRWPFMNRIARRHKTLAHGFWHLWGVQWNAFINLNFLSLMPLFPPDSSAVMKPKASRSKSGVLALCFHLTLRMSAIGVARSCNR